MGNYRTQSGRIELEQGSPIRGSRGKVYGIVNRPGEVAKVYRSSSMAGDDAEERVDVLMSLGAKCPELREYVALPKEKVYDESGAFAGYTMDRVEGETLASVARSAIAPLPVKLLAAEALCLVVATLHSMKLVVGDLALENAIWAPVERKVVLVDADSIQIEVRFKDGRNKLFPTREAHVMSPSMGISGLGGRLPKASDDFLCAVSVFQLAFGGNPFSDQMNDVNDRTVVEENARKGKPVKLADPDARKVAESALGKELLGMLMVAFKSKGSIPDTPKAEELATALRKHRESGYRLCPHCLEEKPAHQGVCYACGSIDPIGMGSGAASAAQRAKDAFFGATSGIATASTGITAFARSYKGAIANVAKGIVSAAGVAWPAAMILMLAACIFGFPGATPVVPTAGLGSVACVTVVAVVAGVSIAAGALCEGWGKVAALVAMAAVTATPTGSAALGNLLPLAGDFCGAAAAVLGL